jgi:hypothetical protein
MKSITRNQYLKACKTVEQYMLQAKKDIELKDKLFKQNFDNFIGVTKETLIDECYMSTRLRNALFSHDAIRRDSKVGDLDDLFTEHELLRYRNLGKTGKIELNRLFNVVGIKYKNQKP